MRPFFIAYLFCASPVFANPVTLDIADVQIVGFNADDPDQFIFVVWKDITNGTRIEFSDRGWTGSGFGTANASEGTTRWRNETGGTIDAGTVILFDDGDFSVGDNDTPNTQGEIDLGSNGDQIFAFQGTTTNPDFSSGIDFDAGTGWYTGSTPRDDRSLLPSELSGTNGDMGFADADNGRYTGPRTGLTIAQYQSRIADSSNWEFSNSDRFTLSTTAFSFNAAPEPGTTSLILLGAVAGGIVTRRRRKQQATEDAPNCRQ